MLESFQLEKCGIHNGIRMNTILSRREYWEKLRDFTPNIHDAFIENPMVREEYRHRAYCAGELYYKFYSEITPYIKPQGSLIDVGAHPGTFLRLCQDVFFPGYGLRLVGTGLLLRGIEEGFRAKAKKCKGVPFFDPPVPFDQYMHSLGIEFIEMNLDYCHHSIPELDPSLIEAFDAVISMEVIEHLHTPYRFINLIERLMKPGGVAIIETNDVANVMGIFKLFFTGYSNLDFEFAECHIPGDYTVKHPHIRFYSLQEIAYMLKKSGLFIKKAESFSWGVPAKFKNGFYWRETLREALYKVFPHKQSHILVKAEKAIP